LLNQKEMATSHVGQVLNQPCC